jgi:hypothetical protein
VGRGRRSDSRCRDTAHLSAMVFVGLTRGLDEVANPPPPPPPLPLPPPMVAASAPADVASWAPPNVLGRVASELLWNERKTPIPMPPTAS